jgi:hypothetical protein
MNRRAATTIAILIATSAGGAYGQQHDNTSGKNERIAEPTIAPTTLQISLPITLLPSQPVEPFTYPETYNPPHDGHGGSDDDPAWSGIVAWLTRWVRDPLTVITTLLVVLTWRYVVHAASQANSIVKSVKLNLDEFHATHRPQLEVRFVRGVPDGVEISAINVETADAIFVAARATIMHITAGDPIPSPHEIVAGDFTLRGRFEPSQSDRFTVTKIADDFGSGFGGQRYVFGWIIYDTSTPKPTRRTTYFGRMQVPLQTQFVPVEASDWNFIQ